MRFLGAIWKWLLNILLALDFLGNAITLGDPRETWSSRMGKKATRGDCWLCQRICAALNKVDPRHCGDAVDWSEGRGSESDDSVIGYLRRKS